jgi:hypothetical protein
MTHQWPVASDPESFDFQENPKLDAAVESQVSKSARSGAPPDFSVSVKRQPATTNDII